MKKCENCKTKDRRIEEWQDRATRDAATISQQVHILRNTEEELRREVATRDARERDLQELRRALYTVQNLMNQAGIA